MITDRYTVGQRVRLKVSQTYWNGRWAFLAAGATGIVREVEPEGAIVDFDGPCLPLSYADIEPVGEGAERPTEIQAPRSVPECPSLPQPTPKEP